MNDLDDLLRDSGRDLTLHAPLSDVTVRGTTLRHRRNARRGALTATAALALVGGGLAVAATTGSDGSTDAPGGDLVAAGWSSSLQGLPAADQAAYTALCRTEGNRAIESGVAAGIPAAATGIFDTAPVATTPLAPPSDAVAALIFKSDGAFATCVIRLEPDGDPYAASLQSLPHYRETGEHVTPTGGVFGNAQWALSAGVVGPDVAAVHVVVDGTPVGATVESGIYAVAVPTATRQSYRAATVEAYDADGDLLETVPLVP